MYVELKKNIIFLSSFSGSAAPSKVSMTTTQQYSVPDADK